MSGLGLLVYVLAIGLRGQIISVVVCGMSHAAPRIHLFARAGNGWLHIVRYGIIRSALCSCQTSAAPEITKCF